MAEAPQQPVVSSLNLNDLPDELLEPILEHAAKLGVVEGTQPSMTTLAVVCSRWRDIVGDTMFRKSLRHLICSIDPSLRYVNNATPVRVLGIHIPIANELCGLAAMKGELYVYRGDGETDQRHQFIIYGHPELSANHNRLSLKQESITLTEKRRFRAPLPGVISDRRMRSVQSCSANNSLYCYIHDRSRNFPFRFEAIRADASTGKRLALWEQVVFDACKTDMTVARSGQVLIKDRCTIYQYSEDGTPERKVELSLIVPEVIRHYLARVDLVGEVYLVHHCGRPEFTGTHEPVRFSRIHFNDDGEPTVEASDVPLQNSYYIMMEFDENHFGVGVTNDRLGPHDIRGHVDLLGPELTIRRQLAALDSMPLQNWVCYDRDTEMIWMGSSNVILAMRPTRFFMLD